MNSSGRWIKQAGPARDRLQKAAELAGQHGLDQDHRQAHRAQHRAESLLPVLGLAADVEAVARRRHGDLDQLLRVGVSTARAAVNRAVRARAGRLARSANPLVNCRLSRRHAFPGRGSAPAPGSGPGCGDANGTATGAGIDVHCPAARSGPWLAGPNQSSMGATVSPESGRWSSHLVFTTDTRLAIICLSFV